MGFPCSSAAIESACNAGDSGSIPGLERSPGEGLGYPIQYSWASLVAQLVKNPPAVRETWVRSWIGKIPWRRERLPTPVFWPGEFHGRHSLRGHRESDVTFTFQQKPTALGLPCWSFHRKSFHWKNLSSSAGDVGLIPGWRTKIPHALGATKI